VTAAEVLPEPRAVTCPVFVDSERRVLTVRLPDQAGGYERHLWIQAWQQLRRAQEAGWPVGGPGPVPADVPAGRLVHGLPVDGAQLAFSFPVGTPGFAELVSKPGVTAVVTLDRSRLEFLRCRFLTPAGRRDAAAVRR
jgi:hypothetical protein